MKRIVYFSIFIGLLSLLSSCGKGWLTDLAVNPNQPSQAPGQLILPAVLNDYATHINTGYNTEGTWMGFMDYSGGYSIDLNTNNYVILNTYGDWDFWFQNLTNADYIEKLGESQQGGDYLAAVGKILKAFGFQYLVDSYNECPYSQAFQGSKNFFPSYDMGTDIYKACIAQLDSAIAIIQAAQNKLGVQDLGNNDIMFHGNMDNWLKFANTLKLRYLLRESKVQDPSAEIAKTANVGYLTFDATVNPGYLNTTGKINPIYSSWGLTPGGSLGGNYKFLMAGGALMNFYKMNNDPRLFYVFAPANITPATDSFNVVITDTSRYQTSYFGDRATASHLVATTGQSGLGHGIVKSFNQDAILMSAAESYFMQAEAVQRGWMSGNAQDLFQKGITANFEYLGLTDADAQAYYTNGKVLCDWTATPDSRKIEAIITQKWAASAIIDNYEAWAEYRRTGFPISSILPLSKRPGATNHIPYRYKFPKSESDANPQNYNKAVSQGDDPQNDKIFWMP